MYGYICVGYIPVVGVKRPVDVKPLTSYGGTVEVTNEHGFLSEVDIL